MLKKWKSILFNWIHCYFNEIDKNEDKLQPEVLHVIISHLRQSFNLDESKSSILAAHTIEEFILEKFPEFKFENGTLTARNETELCIAASLLLFFVCVNSKEVDIKNAMCSGLSREDQEIILKFSKNLMECSPILYSDVQSAITEACNKGVNSRSQITVADTPPVLRSLHSEVRRLQAALDAEQFDRNYLQDELARTQLHVEKLLKDKDQYKLDIVHLKGKLSQCSKQEEDVSQTEAQLDVTANLKRELQEIESQLIQTRAELNDVVCDRAIYKSKVEVLKKERDKWLTLSQQEAIQVTQLTEELESEKRNIISLNEIISDLQLHNKLNRVDSSLLECDDLDRSLHSFHNNSSVCNEACTNVIELQLGEERAKIIVLEQQIQTLQDQMKELNDKYNCDKQTYETMLNKRETEVFNLKHQINEEIEEKSNLKVYFDNEITKLNNEVNELEQRLKGNNENSRAIIDRKMQEIKILQEEKLLLLESLNDETTKNKGIIKSLKDDIDLEKRTKLNMKDCYESQIMKLKEKILNRNNELVELQNNISKNSEIIESLHLDLRKEKERVEEISNKYYNDLQQLCNQKANTEQYLQQKSNELAEQKIITEQKIAIINDLQTEINSLKLSLDSIKVELNCLEDTKDKLVTDVSNCDIKLKDSNKEIDRLNKLLNDEKEKLSFNLDEQNATINSLKKQLHDEIQYKLSLQSELAFLQKNNTQLSEELNTAHSEVTLSKAVIDSNNETIKEMDKYLQKEKECNAKLVSDVIKSDEHLNKLRDELNKDKIEMKLLNDKYKNSMRDFQEEIQSKEEILQSVNEKLNTIIIEKESLKENNFIINNENRNLEKDLKEKSNMIMRLEAERDNWLQAIEEDKLAVEQKLVQINKIYKELENSFDIETFKIISKLNKTEKSIEELSANLKHTIKNQKLQIEKLNLEHQKAFETIHHLEALMLEIQSEKEALFQKLAEELHHKNSFEQEYQKQCLILNQVTAQFSEELDTRNKELNELKTQLGSSAKVIEEKDKEMQILNEKMFDEINELRNLLLQKTVQIEELNSKIDDLTSCNNELEVKCQQKKDNDVKTIQILKSEIEQLQFAIKEVSRNHEAAIKEKDNNIEYIEQKINNTTAQLATSEQNCIDLQSTVDKLQLESKEKEEIINNLLQQIINLKQEYNTVEKSNNEQTKEITKEKEELEVHLKSRILMLQETLSVIEEKYYNLEKEKDDVVSQYDKEKTLRNHVQLEKDNLLHENMVMSDDNKQLSNAKANLIKKLLLQKSINKDLEEHRSNLSEEKELLGIKLAEMIDFKEKLNVEKDYLNKQLFEINTEKEMLLREKEKLLDDKIIIVKELNTEKESIINLKEEIIDLTKKHTNLNEEYISLKNKQEMLAKDLDSLNKKFIKENLYKTELIKEKQSINSVKESLESELLQCKAVNDALLTDKEILLLDKEALAKSLNNEKSTLDEVEKENKSLKIIIEDLQTEYDSKMLTRDKELKDKVADITLLEEEYEELKQYITETSTKLNSVIEKLIQILQQEKVDNKVIQELSLDNFTDMLCSDKCDVLINIANTLTIECSLRNDLEKALEDRNSAFNELQENCNEKDNQIINLQSDIKRFEQVINEQNLEFSKQTDGMSSSINSKIRDIQTLEKENETITNSLNDVKYQLEIKVHSLKEKLTDNENLTDKLKRSYDCQIDNLNLMVAKLTNYLKEKTTELEALRKQNEELKQTLENNTEVIKSLEDEVKSNKQNQEKIISDFESERLVLQNMVTVTECVMEDQKISLSNTISQHVKENAILHQDNDALRETLEQEKEMYLLKLKQKDAVLQTVLNELSILKQQRDELHEDVTVHYQSIVDEVKLLKDELNRKIVKLQTSETLNRDNTELEKLKDAVNTLEKENNELKIKVDAIENEKQSSVKDLTKLLDEQMKTNENLEAMLQEKTNYCEAFEEKVNKLADEINSLINEKSNIEINCKTQILSLEENNVQLNSKLASLNEDLQKLTKENSLLLATNEENKAELTNLKQTHEELKQNAKLIEDFNNERQALLDKCSILKDYQVKAEKLLEERQREINTMQQEITTLTSKMQECVEDLVAKDGFISKVSRDKDEIINAIRRELSEEKSAREKIAASYMAAISAKQNTEDKLSLPKGRAEVGLLLNEDNKEDVRPIITDEDRLLHQVDNTTHLAHSSTDSLKTISDLEMILDDKNRKITTLQVDITHLRSILAESETQLIDVRVELEMSHENCQQLSNQLKKIVYQKNEEIADLRRQVNKMSVTENRATQIIKVSAKYQAIILKKIAEIKSNNVLKELTNFGNTNSSEELRRNLPGSVTMEDLESFLETTDRHINRCAEKQAALQKERDRLLEVNQINESEIINLRKYLTEISLSYQTFISMKDMYLQKLSRVLSIQRTVRREIFNLDGHIKPSAMCKLERGYGAIMQDLSECVMNLERWVERCIAQTVTPEKIKQVLLMSRSEAIAFNSTGIQNTSLEVHIEELGNSFQKLLEEAARASKGEGAVDVQAATVKEVQAAYEDKLNRMKSKMNELYHEQIGKFKEKQREDITLLKRELEKTRDKLAKSSEEYEDHIRKITLELWRVGDKFVAEKAEADGLRRKNCSGSLMSLQHVHSSGLVPTFEKIERPSDTYSLRSLPMDGNARREGGDLHMSDEGEVFDNRCLKELSATPRRESQPPSGLRLSELRWRNSLCPPHLKSSYPAETQFVQTLEEEDIKCADPPPTVKPQRKEVGITAYKKPGPPTPSKQAGRLSATGSELRESLRVEVEPNASRRTATPSRIRSFFRSGRTDTNEGTPRSRKLSGFFRKM